VEDLVDVRWQVGQMVNACAHVGEQQGYLWKPKMSRSA
jgi:hypothetical protein